MPDIMPIIESRCVNCHGGNRTEEGLNLTTHANILSGSDNGPVVTPGDAVNSLLVEMVATQKMPKRGLKLTPPQIQLITDWVNQGCTGQLTPITHAPCEGYLQELDCRCQTFARRILRTMI